MPRTRNIVLALCAIGIVAGGAYWYRNVTAPTDETFALLTEDQMAERAAAEEPKVRGLDVTNTKGPLIRVSAPSGRSLSSPVNFDIKIEPNGGVPVNMSTIRIEYKIGPAWVNVTRTILKYASITGSRLHAKGAELPPGNHLLRVSVADDKSRKTQATVKFSVSN